MKESDKTRTYSDSNKTSIYGDSGKRTKESVHNLYPGDKITLNEQQYIIIKVISESTGEAIIYEVENVEAKTLVLKLYYEFNSAEYEPNTEALIRIKTIDDDDILQLIDYGTGINKYKGKYCFEILDFAEGFDLLSVENLKEKYSCYFIEKEIIPQIYKGILRLHNNKIYHCDLKPQNIFYLDKEQKEIVIGDYGSAKTFEFDAVKSSRKTTTVKGTDFYLPPEQARGFISEKNDYYSFGMILLHLVYPEKILLNENKPKSLSHEKLKQIIERQFEAKPIIDYNPNYKRINSLIEGLTLVDFNLRWGKEQVQKWIDGKELEVIYSTSYQKIADDIGVSVKTLKFSGYSINTVQDLREYILNDPNWYVDLIEDTENRKDFSDWLLDLFKGDRSKRSAFNRIVKNYSPEGIDFVADAIIRFFIPKQDVLLGVQSFNFAESDDILETTALAFSHLIFDLWDNSTEKDIKLFIFSYEFALGQTKNQAEANRALKILYQKLFIDENTESNFEDYKVFAYTKINKGSLEIINVFLIELLACDYKIEVISLDKENNIHYNVIASLPSYLQRIYKDKTLIDKSLENQTISLNYPGSLEPFDDFIEKTFESFLKDIRSKHNILIDLSPKPLEKIKESIKNIFRNTIKNIENELTNLGENFSEELKMIHGFSINLNTIYSFLQNIKYDKTQQVYKDILSLKSELKKVVETKEIFNKCHNIAKKSSPALPLLKKVGNLIKSNNYMEIVKAWQILTNERSFKIETPFNIQNIKKHIEIAYKKIGRYTKIKTDSDIESLAMSYDGNYIVAGSFKSIMVFHTKHKKLAFAHNNIKSDLNRITISKDGKYIAYTDQGMECAFVYDFFSGKRIRYLEKKGHVAYGLAFSPDGKYLAVSGNDTLFWNIKTWKVEKIVNAQIEVSFYPYENIFVSIGKHQILLTNYDTWESSVISDTLTKGSNEICLSSVGELVAIGNHDKFIRIWDVKTAKLLHALPRPEFNNDWDEPNICFSPDGKLLASVPKSDSVCFWSMETGEPVLTIKKLKNINGLAFHPGGDYLVIAYEDNLLFIYMKNSVVESTCNMKILDFINYENEKSEE